MKRGFTLIELSIVFIVIGLLVGGILVGQSMIRTAALRTVATDVEKYATAISQFQAKYASYPGDMADATAYWGKDNASCMGDSGTAATPGTCNGTGDGRIYPWGAAASEYEVARAWQQLGLAGLIDDGYTGLGGIAISPGINAPTSKLQGGFFLTYLGIQTGTAEIFAGTYNHAMGYGGQVTGALSRGPLITPLEAFQFDEKMDDGKPGMGKVLSYPTASSVTPGCTNSASSTAAVYNTTNENTLCSLLFALGF